MAETGVIMIVLMLQVCHGCPADPDRGISTEVLMIQICPEAHYCTARQKNKIVPRDILSRIMSRVECVFPI